MIESDTSRDRNTDTQQDRQTADMAYKARNTMPGLRQTARHAHQDKTHIDMYNVTGSSQTDRLTDIPGKGPPSIC